jgi:hypothetical protein
VTGATIEATSTDFKVLNSSAVALLDFNVSNQGETISSSGSNGTRGLTVLQQSTNYYAFNVVEKSRGSLGSPSNVVNGDTVGAYIFGGYATAYEDGAAIFGVVDSTVSNASVPTALSFSTGYSGAALYEVMRLSNLGALTLDKYGVGNNTGTLAYGLGVTSGGSVIEYSVLTNPMTSAGQMIYGGASGVLTAMAAGTQNQVVAVNSSGNPAFTNNGTVVAKADAGSLTGAQTITSYAVPGSGGNNNFEVGGYINVQSITVDVIQLQVTFTGGDDNTSHTITLNSGSLASLTTTGYYLFPTAEITVKKGTTITVLTNLTTSSGSINYNSGAFIRQIY